MAIIFSDGFDGPAFDEPQTQSEADLVEEFRFHTDRIFALIRELIQLPAGPSPRLDQIRRDLAIEYRQYRLAVAKRQALRPVGGIHEDSRSDLGNGPILLGGRG
jgi:hypothetical protein